MLKSTLKYEKLEFLGTGRLARSCQQGARSCHPMSWDHARPCHKGARSCHSLKCKILIFQLSRFHTWNSDCLSVFTNASHLSPIIKQCFPISKQLNPLHPKRLVHKSV